MSGKPTLVVVTGYPATGKTSLARHVSAELCIPMVAKDAIKERLFDVLGMGEPEWSHLLGRASLAVLYEQVRSVLAIRHSVIAEANFDAELGGRDLRAILADHPAHVIRVVLVCDPDVLIERCRKRAESGERHPGHDDYWVAEELARLVQKRYEPPDLPGPIFEVDATDLDALDFGHIVELVRQAMP